MNEYRTTILLNGNAELGSLVTWDALNTKIVFDVVYGGYHYLIGSKGYMKQLITPSLFALTSARYKFALSYVRSKPLSITEMKNQAFASITYAYEDGIQDIYIIPFQAYTTTWHVAEAIAQIRDDSKLTEIFVEIYNNESMGVRVDSIQLLPSMQLLQTSGPLDSEFNDFKDKSILYGLESELPELGG